MALPVVESNSGSTYESNSADDTLTLTKPSGVVSGDLMVALVAKDINTDAVTSSGWTAGVAKVTGGTAIQITIFWKVAGGSEPSTYDFTWDGSTGSVMGGGIIRISGAHATDPFHVSGSATDNSSSIDCPDITTTVDDCLILRLMASDDNRYTDNSTPSGHTVLWADDTALGTDMTSGAAHEDLATAGSPGVGSFTGLAGAERWVAVTLAIQPAAGGLVIPVAMGAYRQRHQSVV